MVRGYYSLTSCFSSLLRAGGRFFSETTRYLFFSFAHCKKFWLLIQFNCFNDPYNSPVVRCADGDYQFMGSDYVYQKLIVDNPLIFSRGHSEAAAEDDPARTLSARGWYDLEQRHPVCAWLPCFQSNSHSIHCLYIPAWLNQQGSGLCSLSLSISVSAPLSVPLCPSLNTSAHCSGK